jgi:hypothetical protein
MKGLVFWMISHLLTWVFKVLLPWMNIKVEIFPDVAQTAFVVGGSITGAIPGWGLDVSAETPVSQATAQKALDDLGKKMFWIGLVLLVMVLWTIVGLCVGLYWLPSLLSGTFF